MLVTIDTANGHDFIIEELDEEHLLVKETKINELKSRLNQVSDTLKRSFAALTVLDDAGTTEGAREFRFRVAYAALTPLLVGHLHSPLIAPFPLPSIGRPCTSPRTTTVYALTPYPASAQLPLEHRPTSAGYQHTTQHWY
jgi:hypothetical protein